MIVAALALGLLAGVGRAAAPSSPLQADDMVMGAARAPVTVIEYASLGCPHCAVWANTVFPAFRKTWIDSGQVRFVFREMLFGNSTLAAAGFLTARCAGPDKYFQAVDAIFADQAQIEAKGVGEMLRVAKTAGLTEARFTACLKDAPALKALQARSDRHMTVDAVDGTPTFVIGRQRLEGERSLAELAAAIAAAKRP